MASSLIETSEEDSFLAVAQHVGALLDEGQSPKRRDGSGLDSARHAEDTERWSLQIKTNLAATTGSDFAAKAEALIAQQQTFELLQLLLSQLGLVLQKSEAKDSECTINIICHLVARVPDSQQQAAADAVTDALRRAAPGGEFGEQRLEAMLALYNQLGAPAIKVAVLKQVLEFAQEVGQQEAIGAVISGQVEKLAQTWGLPPALCVQLYCTAAAVFQACESPALKKQAFELQSLALAMAVPGMETELRPVAVAAVSSFIGRQDLYTCDIHNLPMVRQLAADADNAELHCLLLIMLTGDIKAFRASDFSASLARAQMTPEACLDKLRLMALLALGSQQQGPVSFSEVQEALQIENDDVEPWLIRAVGLKLLEARIDQRSQMVVFTRCTHRSFGEGEWRSLQQRLAQWRDTVASTLEMTTHAIQSAPA